MVKPKLSTVEQVPPVPALAPGARVRIVGLESAAGLQLNGLEAELQSFSHRSGRWDVLLDSGDGKSIKPANLEVRTGIVSDISYLPAITCT